MMQKMIDEEVPKKRKRGRPKKDKRFKYKAGEIIEPDYTLSHPERLIKLMEQGLFNYEVCSNFDICTETFYKWKEAYPEFLRAYNIGKAKRFTWWLDKARKALKDGNDKGAKYYTLIMNNMFAEEGWISPYNKAAGTQINVNTMNVLQTQTEAELLENIKQNFERLHDHTKEEMKPILIEVIHDESKET